MFIIGLPRSRTAWLSVFMSQSNTHFYHDGINGCHSLNEYDAKTKDCGDSTTGWLPLFDRIEGEKTVIIKKNYEQLLHCIEWANHEYGFNCEDIILSMNERLLSMKGLVVEQSEIDNSLESIWSHLVDDRWLDRYADLKALNIQVNSTSIDEEAAKALHESIQ